MASTILNCFVFVFSPQTRSPITITSRPPTTTSHLLLNITMAPTNPSPTLLYVMDPLSSRHSSTPGGSTGRNAVITAISMVTGGNNKDSFMVTKASTEVTMTTGDTKVKVTSRDIKVIRVKDTKVKVTRVKVSREVMREARNVKQTDHIETVEQKNM